MPFLRRTLAFIVLPVLLVSAAGSQVDRAAEPSHEDPLVQGVQDHLDRLCRAHDARAAAIKTPQQLEAAAREVRSRLLKTLDLHLDTPRKPPPVQRVGLPLEYPEYRIERLILESSPGVPVPCNLYVPKHGPLRKPALLVPHGHSGRDRPVYQNGYQRLAKAGFIVLAKDGWGKQERRGTGHGAEGGQLFLTGTSLMSLELWDNVRCVDYLLSRPDVDGERLGMVGLSGGGSQTLYTMAIEPRLKAGSPTCAVTTFRADLADTTMCVCELAADLLNIGDHGWFLAASYPRPLLVVNGTRDPIFPIAGARFATSQAQQLYGVGGQAEKVRFAEFDTDHDWSDPMLTLQIQWFRKQFGLPALPDPPLGDVPIAYEKLQCYPNGEIPTGALTLTAVNRRRMRGGPEAEKAPEMEAKVARRLRTTRHRVLLSSRRSGEPQLPTFVTARDLGPDASRLFAKEQLTWASGLGGPVSAAITIPLRLTLVKPLPVVVRLDRDRLVPQIDRLYWDERVRSQAIVVDFDYTGRRLSPVVEGQVSTALIASGRSLLAERVRDLEVLLKVLRSRGLLREDRKLAFYGHGFDGVLLLAAASELPSESHLVLDETPITYRTGSEIDFRTSDSLAPPAHWTILPNVARSRDLTDLIGLSEPRELLFLYPQDAAQQRLNREEATHVLQDQHFPPVARVVTQEATRRACLAAINNLISQLAGP